MFQKVMNACKKNILLRSFFACVTVVCLCCGMVLPSLAAPIDYNDYVYKVEVDGDNELVYVKIPADFARVRVFRTSDNVRIYDGLGAHHDIPFESEVEYRVYLDVFGAREVYSNALDLSYIPVGTQIASGFGFEETGDWGAMSSPVAHVSYYYFETGNPEPLSVITNNTEQISSWDWFYDVHIVQNVAEANLLTIDYFLEPVYFMYEPWTGLYVQDTTLVFSISSLLRQQQATGKTNALLKEVEAQLAEQGKTLDDIRDQMQDANDKLDELPGQIGDEMQGVIDSEKEESKGEGNKFVDQILDALPDPSTDVLAALKSLTDSTAYTGTEAMLSIPAIVLPGIGDLFPSTEIWGGAEFDFGEYVGLLPSSLLTLVQSLFTIAIVLYAVYELKGIISYCLTLRESKGG